MILDARRTHDPGNTSIALRHAPIQMWHQLRFPPRCGDVDGSDAGLSPETLWHRATVTADSRTLP
jgi:hypothetical protein